MKKYVLLMVAFFFLSLTAQAQVDTAPLKFIPMQDNGRLKPYDTFARETLLLLYGKTTYNGRPAHEVIMTWFILPEAWSEKSIIHIERAELKETLKLDKEKKHFSPNELFAN